MAGGFGGFRAKETRLGLPCLIIDNDLVPWKTVLEANGFQVVECAEPIVLPEETPSTNYARAFRIYQDESIATVIEARKAGDPLIYLVFTDTEKMKDPLQLRILDLLVDAGARGLRLPRR